MELNETNQQLKLIQRNLILINDKIAKASKLYDRKPSEIELIAVSKTVTKEKIIEAIECGCHTFGENYLKESLTKWPEIKQLFPQVKLHFIGHLQSNKAAEAVSLFDCIETLDSEKLALVLQKEVGKQQKNIEVFIQVNVGEEAQKGGVLPNEVASFVAFAQQECHLNVTGLMCIPPANESGSPYFALLAKMAQKNGLKKLSMGMSADFEEAIALGATSIRLGSAIFGARS